MAPEAKKKIFISYSNENTDWKNKLVKHFEVLVKEGLLDIWTNDTLKLGENLTEKIKKNIIESDVIILLLSPAYLISSFIKQKHIPQIRERNEKYGAKVIPIFVEPFSETSAPWLSNIKGLPYKGKPLSQCTENEVDLFLSQLVTSLKKFFNFQQMQFENPSSPNICDRNNEPVIGVKELAKELSELIKNQISDEAIMIGVFGQWGRGKTYLMEQIWKHLKEVGENNNFTRVDFHAWKYQETPASWAYLYEAFSSKYFELPEKEDCDKLKNKNKRKYFICRYIGYYFRYFLRVLINFGRVIKLNLKTHGIWPIVIFSIIFFTSLISVSIQCILKIISNLIIPNIIFSSAISLSLIGVLITAVSKHRKKAIQLFKKYTKKKEYAHLLGLQKEIQDELKNLLKTWINEKDLLKNKRILLVVDDMDRCSEERLIQVVDSLRVMLEDRDISKRVIALVAVDDRILARAIHCKYKGIIDVSNGLEHISIETLAQEYLDKLFLVGVKLNPLNKDEKEEILQSIVCDKLRPQADEPPSNKVVKPNPDNIVEPVPPGEDGNNPTNIGNSPITIGTYGITEEERDPMEEKTKISSEVNKYQINVYEYERLQEILPCLENATPRSIRILYYQYLLAKRLVENGYQLQDKNSSKPFTAKERNIIFDLLHLIYCHRSSEKRHILHNELSKIPLLPDQFYKFKSEKEEGKDKESKRIYTNGAQIKPILERLNQIEAEKRLDLLRIIEIVVAY